MSKESLPQVVDASGVRFNAASAGGMNIARVRLPKGADATPLLKGLPGDLCHAPHWGYVVKGRLRVRFADGREETVSAGDVYHWPAGHTVQVEEDYEAVEFSPEDEMGQVLSHLRAQLEPTRH